ncbi:hypothetical protein [Pseudomonas sp. GD03944]|uniref:tetratricopeptide repeat protein n=1 Tax=Pseudomonas sp. GD03944 TaxID=2975409 RepID=UPI0024486B72|nr:hypothetical protein [Pseudomonas sp. GD03944]MDH1262930.1 hypothetical protein [Pseudomonas sp. GD03944]
MDEEKDISKLLAEAERQINNGSSSKARDILIPLVDQSNAHALFLYASFSVAKIETTAEFEKRSIAMLCKAVELGHAAAAYSLGVRYEFGDGVVCDNKRAALLFKQSAEKGYPKAMLSYGLDLVYGSNGIQQSKALGVNMIKDAAMAGVPEAFEELSALGESI